MQWLNKVADEIVARQPEGEIVVSSGVSPSGTYHLGTLREVLTAEAIMYELKQRGRQAKHLHIVDDLDVFRKVPSNVPADFKKYLGQPLCDIPAPDGSDQSYADYYLSDLSVAAEKLGLEVEIIRAHQKYREGFFTEAIEKALDNQQAIREILESVSGHKVDQNWSPIQVLEEGYLKNRRFISLDKQQKTLTYEDKDGQEQKTSYSDGQVKLNWRVDWPARWWRLEVKAEPFGRDHATKGGSYDTGVAIAEKVYGIQAPLPLPYEFINRSGETKKMSKSSGDVITVAELLNVLPPEVIWYFILRYPPNRQLFFDEGEGLVKLVDDFGQLLAKADRSEAENKLLAMSLREVKQPTISRVPFSHLVASYQAALHDAERTIDVLKRTEYHDLSKEDEAIIKNELAYIEFWLKSYAPDELKFDIAVKPNYDGITEPQKAFLARLAGVISSAPEGADGQWFHQAIYGLKDSSGLDPKDMFAAIYKVLINKDYGPRAGWFLSILPREKLVNRLRLKDEKW